MERRDLSRDEFYYSCAITDLYPNGYLCYRKRWPFKILPTAPVGTCYYESVLKSQDEAYDNVSILELKDTILNAIAPNWDHLSNFAEWSANSHEAPIEHNNTFREYKKLQMSQRTYVSELMILYTAEALNVSIYIFDIGIQETDRCSFVFKEKLPKTGNDIYLLRVGEHYEALRPSYSSMLGQPDLKNPMPSSPIKDFSRRRLASADYDSPTSSEAKSESTKLGMLQKVVYAKKGNSADVLSSSEQGEDKKKKNIKRRKAVAKRTSSQVRASQANETKETDKKEELKSEGVQKTKAPFVSSWAEEVEEMYNQEKINFQLTTKQQKEMLSIVPSWMKETSGGGTSSDCSQSNLYKSLKYISDKSLKILKSENPYSVSLGDRTTMREVLSDESDLEEDFDIQEDWDIKIVTSRVAAKPKPFAETTKEEHQRIMSFGGTRKAKEAIKDHGSQPTSGLRIGVVLGYICSGTVVYYLNENGFLVFSTHIHASQQNLDYNYLNDLKDLRVKGRDDHEGLKNALLRGNVIIDKNLLRTGNHIFLYNRVFCQDWSPYYGALPELVLDKMNKLILSYLFSTFLYTKNDYAMTHRLIYSGTPGAEDISDGISLAASHSLTKIAVIHAKKRRFYQMPTETSRSLIYDYFKNFVFDSYKLLTELLPRNLNLVVATDKHLANEGRYLEFLKQLVNEQQETFERLTPMSAILGRLEACVDSLVEYSAKLETIKALRRVYKSGFNSKNRYFEHKERHESLLKSGFPDERYKRSSEDHLARLEEEYQSNFCTFNKDLDTLVSEDRKLLEEVHEIQKQMTESIATFFHSINVTKIMTASGATKSAATLESLINFTYVYPRGENLSSDDTLLLDKIRITLLDLIKSTTMARPLPMLFKDVDTEFNSLFKLINKEYVNEAQLLYYYARSCTSYDLVWNTLLKLKGVLYEILFAQSHQFKYIPEILKPNLQQIVQTFYPLKFQDFLNRTTKHTEFRSITPDFFFLHTDPNSLHELSQELQKLTQDRSLPQSTATIRVFDSVHQLPQSVNDPQDDCQSEYSMSTLKVPVNPLPEGNILFEDKEYDKAMERVSEVIREAAESGTLIRHTDSTTTVSNLLIIETGFVTDDENKSEQDWDKWQGPMKVLNKIGINVRLVVAIDSSRKLGKWFIEDRYREALKCSISKLFGQLTRNSPENTAEFHVSTISTTHMRKLLKSSIGMVPPIMQIDIQTYWDKVVNDIRSRPTGATLPPTAIKRLHRLMVKGTIFDPDSAHVWFKEFFTPQRLDEILSIYMKNGVGISELSQSRESAKKLIHGWVDSDSKLLLGCCMKKSMHLSEKFSILQSVHLCEQCGRTDKLVKPLPRLLEILPDNFTFKHQGSKDLKATELDEAVRLILPSFSHQEKSIKKCIHNIIKASMLLSGIKAVKDSKGVIMLCPGTRDTMKQMLLNPSKKDMKDETIQEKIKDYTAQIKKDHDYLNEHMKSSYSKKHVEVIENLYRNVDKQQDSGCALKDEWIDSIYSVFSLGETRSDKARKMASTLEKRSGFEEKDRFWKIDESVLSMFLKGVYVDFDCLGIDYDSGLEPDCVIFEEQMLILEAQLRGTVYSEHPQIIRNVLSLIIKVKVFQYYMFMCLLANEFLTCTTEFNSAAVKMKKIKHSPYNLVMKIPTDKRHNVQCCIFDSDFRRVGDVFMLNRTTASLWKSYPYLIFSLLMQSLQTHSVIEFFSRSSETNNILEEMENMKDSYAEKTSTCLMKALRGDLLMPDFPWLTGTRKAAQVVLSTVNSLMIVFGFQLFRNSKVFNKQIQMLRFSYMASLSHCAQFYELGKKFSSSCRYSETHVARLALMCISYTSIYYVKKNIDELLKDSIRPKWKIMSSINFLHYTLSDRTMINDSYIVHLFNKEMEDYDKGCEAIFEEMASKYFEYEEDIKKTVNSYVELHKLYTQLVNSPLPETNWEQRETERRIENVKRDYDLALSRLNCLLGVPRVPVDKKTRDLEKDEILMRTNGVDIRESKFITGSSSSESYSDREERKQSPMTDGQVSSGSKGKRAIVRESNSINDDIVTTRSWQQFVFRKYQGSIHSIGNDVALVIDSTDDYTPKAVGVQNIKKYRPKDSHVMDSITTCIEASADYSMGCCELIQCFTELFRTDLGDKQVQSAYRDPDNWCPISRVVETTSIVSQPLLKFDFKEAIKRSKGALTQKYIKILKGITKEVAETTDKSERSQKEKTDAIISDLMTPDLPINKLIEEDVRKGISSKPKNLIDTKVWTTLWNKGVEETIIHPDSNRPYSIIKGIFRFCRSKIDKKRLTTNLSKCPSFVGKEQQAARIVDDFTKLPIKLGEMIFNPGLTSSVTKDEICDFVTCWKTIALEKELFQIDGKTLKPTFSDQFVMDFNNLMTEYDKVTELLKETNISYEKEKIALCTLEKVFCKKHGPTLTRVFFWALQLSSTAYWFSSMKGIDPKIIRKIIEDIEDECQVEKENQTMEDYYMSSREKKTKGLRKADLIKMFIDPFTCFEDFLSGTELVAIRYVCSMFEANNLPIGAIIGGRGRIINSNQFNLLVMLKAVISKDVLMGDTIDFALVSSFIYSSNHNMMRTMTGRKGNLRLPRSVRSKVLFEVIKLVSSCDSAVVQQIAYRQLLDHNHDCYAVLAPKAQYGGVRDLVVQEVGMKMINASSELLAGSFLKLTKFDGLTNPSMTKMMLANVLSELRKSKDQHDTFMHLADNTMDTSMKVVYRVSSWLGDKSKWGPKHIVTLFSAIHQQLHYKNPEFDKCEKLIMLKNLVKKIEVPIAIISKVLNSMLYSKKLSEDEVKTLERETDAFISAMRKIADDWSWKPLVKETILHHLEKGEQYIRPANHMGQGIHHRTSSILTAIWRLVYGMIIEIYCEARLPETLKVETFAVGSSDDYARTITIKGEVPVADFDTINKQIDMLFVDLKNLESAIGAAINTKDSPKTIVSEVSGEVYSQFVVGDRETPAVIKFIVSNMITSNITSPLSLSQMEHVTNQQSVFNSCSILTVMTADLCRRQIHFNYVEPFVRKFGLLLYRSPTSLFHSVCPKLSMLMCNGLAATDLDTIESVLIDASSISNKLETASSVAEVLKNIDAESSIYTSDAESSSSSSGDPTVTKRAGDRIEYNTKLPYSKYPPPQITEKAVSSTCSHYTSSILKLSDECMDLLTHVVSDLPDSLLFEMERKQSDSDISFIVKSRKSQRTFNICLHNILKYHNTIINLMYLSYYRNEIADSIDKQFKATYNLNFGSILKSPFVQLTPSSVLSMVDKLKETQEDLKNLVKKTDDYGVSRKVAERLIGLNCLTEDTIVETSRLLQACKNPRISWGLTQSNKEYSTTILALCINSFFFLDVAGICDDYRWVMNDNVYIKDSVGQNTEKKIKTKFTYWLESIIRSKVMSSNTPINNSELSLFDGSIKPASVEAETDYELKTIYIRMTCPDIKTELLTQDRLNSLAKMFKEKHLPKNLEKLEECELVKYKVNNLNFGAVGLVMTYKVTGQFLSIRKRKIVLNRSAIAPLVEKCQKMRETILDENTKKMRLLEHQQVKGKSIIDDFYVQKSTIYGKRGHINVINNLAVIISYWLDPETVRLLRVLGVKYDHLQSDQDNLAIMSPEISSIVKSIKKLDGSDIDAFTTDLAKIEKYSNHLTSLCRLLGGATNTTMEYYMFSRTSTPITEDLQPLLSISCVEGVLLNIESLTIDTTVFSNTHFLLLEVIGIFNCLPLSNSAKEILMKSLLRSNPNDFTLETVHGECEDSGAEQEILKSFQPQQFALLLQSDITSLMDGKKRRSLAALAGTVIDNPINSLQYSPVSDKTFQTFDDGNIHNERFIYRFANISATGMRLGGKLQVSLNRPPNVQILYDLMYEIMAWQKISGREMLKKPQDYVSLLSNFPKGTDHNKEIDPLDKLYFNYNAKLNVFELLGKRNTKGHYMYIAPNHVVLHKDPVRVENPGPKIYFKKDCLEIRATQKFLEVTVPKSIDKTVKILQNLTNSQKVNVNRDLTSEQEVIIHSIEFPDSFTRKAVRLAHIVLSHLTKSSDKGFSTTLNVARNLGGEVIKKAKRVFNECYQDYFFKIEDRLEKCKTAGKLPGFKMYSDNDISLVISNPYELEEMLNENINSKFDKLEEWPQIQYIADYLDIKIEKWQFNNSASLHWKVHIDHSKYTTVEKKEDLIDSFKKASQGKYSKLIVKLLFVYDNINDMNRYCKSVVDCISHYNLNTNSILSTMTVCILFMCQSMIDLSKAKKIGAQKLAGKLLSCISHLELLSILLPCEIHSIKKTSKLMIELSNDWPIAREELTLGSAEIFATVISIIKQWGREGEGGSDHYQKLKSEKIVSRLNDWKEKESDSVKDIMAIIGRYKPLSGHLVYRLMEEHSQLFGRWDPEQGLTAKEVLEERKLTAKGSTLTISLTHRTFTLTSRKTIHDVVNFDTVFSNCTGYVDRDRMSSTIWICLQILDSISPFKYEFFPFKDTVDHLFRNSSYYKRLRDVNLSDLGQKSKTCLKVEDDTIAFDIGDLDDELEEMEKTTKSAAETSDATDMELDGLDRLSQMNTAETPQEKRRREKKKLRESMEILR